MNEPPIIPAIPLIPPEPIEIPEPTFLHREALLPQYRPVLLPEFSPDELRYSLGSFSVNEPDQEDSASQKSSKRVVAAPIPAPPLPAIKQAVSAPDDNPYPEPSRLAEISLPGTNIKIPIPENELLITAAATAATASVVSVAATMTAQNLAKKIKPIFDQILKRVLNRKPKPHELLSYGRKRLALRRSRRLPSESQVET